jgi:protein phosphatase
MKQEEHVSVRYRSDRGPFDIIGDVHGCLSELKTLLGELGYSLDTLTHPAGRKLVFLGDLVDRGPDSPGVMRLVMDAVSEGRAYCVLGNHDEKFRRWLGGREVTTGGGLKFTIEQMQGESEAFHAAARAFIGTLPLHLILDEGRLVVAHAGLREEWHGIAESTKARAFALFGETSGRRDEWGFPERLDWARDYAGQATVVHGHVAESDVRGRNNVICLDTGCAYGGKLTALRWPERELVQVEAEETWYDSARWAAIYG